LSPLKASQNFIDSNIKDDDSDLSKKMTLVRIMIEENEADLKKNPTDSEKAWCNLFLAYSMKKDHKNTIHCGNKLLTYKLDKEDTKFVYSTMSVACAAHGHLDKAIQHKNIAIKIELQISALDKPSNEAITTEYRDVDLLQLQIKSSFLNKKWAQAIEKIKEFKSMYISVVKDPELEKIQKAAELCAAGKLEEAILVIERWPDHDELVYHKYHLLGTLHEDLKYYEQAIHYFNKLLTISPEDPRILLKVGSILTITGSKDKALDYFQRTLKADSDSMQIGQANMWLASYYVDKQEWHSAICRYAAAFAALSIFDIACVTGLPGFHFALLRFVESVFNKKATPEQIKMVKVTLAALLAKKTHPHKPEFKYMIDLMSEHLTHIENFVKEFSVVARQAINKVFSEQYLKLGNQFAQLNAKDKSIACLKSHDEHQKELSRELTSDEVVSMFLY
jgi:tetratricopeptide (TPR) repeat protein